MGSTEAENQRNSTCYVCSICIVNANNILLSQTHIYDSEVNKIVNTIKIQKQCFF